MTIRQSSLEKPHKPVNNLRLLTYDRYVDDSIDHRNSKATGTCIMCCTQVLSFRDDLSQIEYHGTGLCQRCQDKVFGLTRSELQVELNRGNVYSRG